MLSNNNMLTTGGNRQRYRQSVRVSEPAFGFFIAGSSIDAMNGVYVRRNPPRAANPKPVLYYEHEEGLWHLCLNEITNTESNEKEENDDDYFDYYDYKKKPTHEWMFSDEFGVNRFTHDGDTIVPGAGVRWKHVHDTSTSATVSNIEEDSTAVAEIKEDDEDELPWQVVAILDIETVQDLLWSSEHRKQKVRDAKAGKNAPPLKRASLEASSAPGKWLFRVVSPEGVSLHLEPDESSVEAGHVANGEYVKGIELTSNGEWLKLHKSEDVSRSRHRTRYTYDSDDERHLDEGYSFYNTHYSQRHVWVKVYDKAWENDSVVMLLEEISAENTPILNIETVHTTPASGVLESKNIPNAEESAMYSDEYFDQPFVPRMEDVDGVSNNLDIPSEAECKVSAQDKVSSVSVPVGAAVEISGLVSRQGMQYNGTNGVVIQEADDTGRVGVRLDAPFSGKMLSCKPENLVYRKNDSTKNSEDEVSRYCRLLGLSVSQLSNDYTCQWGYAGSNPVCRINTALRSFIRDVGLDSPSINTAREAADSLRAHIRSKPSDTANTAVPQGLSPEYMLKYGALGCQVASAFISAVSPVSAIERTSGIEALQLIVKNETRRNASAVQSVIQNEGEDSRGSDELLLRVGLSCALLQSRREAEALEEMRIAHKCMTCLSQVTSAVCGGVECMLGKCLLLQGHREEGLRALEKAEQIPSPDVVDPEDDMLLPLSIWGKQEASHLLTCHNLSEKCRRAALDAYARGAFRDATNLYTRALDALKGCMEDKKGRAMTYADKAGCHRRNREFDEAIADLDSALRLFPRYKRALFRRAACLLEAGQAEKAIDGFKDLYRVDRDWPMLSDWLVRAYSLQKRQAKGYHKNDEFYENIQSSGDNSATMDADIVAKEVDHYRVLGVSTDATEKQLKTAYRLRSLKFHPDRKEGHTAAFQRIAEAYEVLSDEEKRRAYDEGGDIKVKRGRRDEDDDSDDSAEEHKTTLREEVEREFYPEKYHFWPFGDPFVYKRKREAQKRAKKGKPAWYDEY